MFSVRMVHGIVTAVCCLALASVHLAPADDAPQRQDRVAQDRAAQDRAARDRAAQDNVNPAAPTATGKVTAYDPEKSITLEVSRRGGAKNFEFVIVKDKTRIDLPPRANEIKVGMVLSVWADPQDPKLAARIGANTPPAAPPNTRRRNNGRGAQPPPTAVGQVKAYDAETSITIEVKERGGKTRQAEFTIVKDQTRIELLGDTKTIAVGTAVSVWADKEYPRRAARIVAGANNPPAQRPRRPNNAPANPNPSPNRPAAAADPSAASTPAPARPARQPVPGLAPANVAAQIDKHIEARLAAENLKASPPSDDAEFLRRVCLDITGLIPSVEKAAAFLDSPDPDKRAKLIDELLDSPQYGRHFADLWCDRIAIKDLPIYREPFIAWMSDSFNQGRGWDEVVFELLTAEGSFNFVTRGKRLSSEDPRALFILLNTEEGAGKGPNPAWLAAESGRLFLGVNLQCAECHNHPFTDSWKQTDFWGLAAFFSQLRAERAQGGLVWNEAPLSADGPVNIVIPATALKSVGQTVPARLLGHDKDYQPLGPQVLRHSLARWITSPDNPYFAQAAANRLWADFFGRGLVNPVDDLREDNPATHPEVLELLAAELKKSQYDLKHAIRCICLSQTYQRTSQPLPDNEEDHVNYSHGAVKIMGPGVFYDSLKAATGLPELKLGLPERKTKLTVLTTFTPREVFVDFFRAAQGEEADPLENTHGIPQALKLMNAAQLNSAAPLVERLAASDLARDQVIEQLHLAAYARRPSPAETRLLAGFLERRNDSTNAQGYSAVLWTLINSAEFLSNH
jgi:hypothetical protein